MTEGLSLFTPPAEQVALLRAWSRQRQWGYTEAEFDHALHSLPIVGSEVSDTVLTLVPYPVDRGEVFPKNRRKAAECHAKRGAELWGITARPFPRHDLWPTTDGAECWTIGLHQFHAGLRWEVLRLHVPVVSFEVREALRLLKPKQSYDPPHAEQSLPHLGVVAALALHPAWVASIAAGTSPCVIVPGYGFNLRVNQWSSTRTWSLLRAEMTRTRLARRMVRLDVLLHDKTVIPELVML